MQSPGVADRLVNVPATHLDIPDGSEMNCDPSELLIDADNPDDSLIFTKVNGRYSCGIIMPIPPRTITPSESACLRAWVFQLAGKEP